MHIQPLAANSINREQGKHHPHRGFIRNIPYLFIYRLTYIFTAFFLGPESRVHPLFHIKIIIHKLGIILQKQWQTHKNSRPKLSCPFPSQGPQQQIIPLKSVLNWNLIRPCLSMKNFFHYWYILQNFFRAPESDVNFSVHLTGRTPGRTTMLQLLDMWYFYLTNVQCI